MQKAFKRCFPTLGFLAALMEIDILPTFSTFAGRYEKNTLLSLIASTVKNTLKACLIKTPPSFASPFSHVCLKA
jgi:hypothetical protein